MLQRTPTLGWFSENDCKRCVTRRFFKLKIKRKRFLCCSRQQRERRAPPAAPAGKISPERRLPEGSSSCCTKLFFKGVSVEKLCLDSTSCQIYMSGQFLLQTRSRTGCWCTFIPIPPLKVSFSTTRLLKQTRLLSAVASHVNRTGTRF